MKSQLLKYALPVGMGLALLIITIFGILSTTLVGCKKGDVCESKSGSVTCGYCKQDAMTSGNPNAGKCFYCPTGSTCSGDVCGTLQCVTAGGGGGGGGCNPTGCPASQPWSGCGTCWATSTLCNTRGTSNLSDDCSVCRKCP